MKKLLDINGSLQVPNMVFKSDVDNSISQITDKAQNLPFVSDSNTDPVYSYSDGVLFRGNSRLRTKPISIDYGNTLTIECIWTPNVFTGVLEILFAHGGNNIMQAYYNPSSGYIGGGALTPLDPSVVGLVFTQGVEYHLAWVKDFTNSVMYGFINGICAVVTSYGNVPSNASYAFSIGRNWSNDNYPLNGDIKLLSISPFNKYGIGHIAGIKSFNPKQPFTHYKRFQSTLETRELNTTPSACSDPNNNESDSVGDFIQYGLDNGANVFESQNTVVDSGSYAIKADSNPNPAANARFYTQLNNYGLIIGQEYTITFKARHVGTGGAWTFRLSSSTNLAAQPYTIVTTLQPTHLTYEEYTVSFTHSEDTRYFGAREFGNNTGGVYFDDLSIVGKTYASKKLFLTSNYLEGAVIDSANQITSIKSELGGVVSTGHTGSSYLDNGIVLNLSGFSLDIEDYPTSNDWHVSYWWRKNEYIEDRPYPAFNQIYPTLKLSGDNYTMAMYGNGDTWRYGTIAIVEKKFHYLSWVHKSNTLYMYVNGVLDAVFSTTYNGTMFNWVFGLAAKNNGIIDDFLFSTDPIIDPTGYSVGDKVFKPLRRKSFDDKFIQYPIP